MITDLYMYDSKRLTTGYESPTILYDIKMVRLAEPLKCTMKNNVNA